MFRGGSRVFFNNFKSNSDEDGTSWLTSVYGPTNSNFRKDFWMELQYLLGLTFPNCCVGGDFNVIRRSSEKLGGSRLTTSIRIFLR